MSEKKIIAVVGATGAQGGGLARAILARGAGKFAARGLTRKVDSEKAQAIRAQGAELVFADLDDPTSLRKAFDGAWGAFCVTNFWEHFSPERELAQAKNLAQSAKAAGVRHVIWSTLEDTRKKVPLSDSRMPTLMQKYKVPHFDAKGEANAFFSEAGVPTTFLHTSFYWDNMIYFGMNPKRGADGRLAITLPMGTKKLPGIAVADIGKCAFGIFENSNDFIGKTIGIAGEHATGAQMAATLSKVLGQEVGYNAVTPSMYASFGFPGAADLANMFQYKADFEADYCARRSIEASRKLNPELMSFEAWVTANKTRIPLE